LGLPWVTAAGQSSLEVLGVVPVGGYRQGCEGFLGVVERVEDVRLVGGHGVRPCRLR